MAPAAGELTHYAPWGNLAIFIKPRSYSRSLLPLGKVDEGLSILSRPGPYGAHRARRALNHRTISATTAAWIKGIAIMTPTIETSDIATPDSLDVGRRSLLKMTTTGIAAAVSVPLLPHRHTHNHKRSRP
jgi:hypothetical protein